MKFISKTATVLLLFIMSVNARSSGTYEIRRSVIADGGGISREGTFKLIGTVGQPEAGDMTGDTYSLASGFWIGIQLADCNEDGGVGLRDFVDFESCLDGPGITPDVGCSCFDVDRNGSVNLLDFATVQTVFTGP